ncbi:MAG: glycosyltransferase [Caldisphaera sp.]
MINKQLNTTKNLSLENVTILLINDANFNSGVGTNVRLFENALSSIFKIERLDIKFFDLNAPKPSYAVNKIYTNNININRMISVLDKIRLKPKAQQIIIFGDAALINFVKNDPDILFFHHPNFLEHPKNYSLMVKLAVKITIKKIEKIKNNALIITLSNYSKNLLSKHTHVAEDRIKVVYPYVDLPKPSQEILENIKKKYNPLSLPLILAVGTSIPLKNFLTLYKAVEDTNMLVLRVGGDEKIERSIYKIPENVKFAGHGNLSLDELSALYSISDVLALTSVDEGFGRPLIEAMYFSLPIVSNKCTTSPEIVGDSGILISDPYDYNQLRLGLYETLKNQEFYRKKVSERSKLFSKEKYIERMTYIIKNIIKP